MTCVRHRSLHLLCVLASLLFKDLLYQPLHEVRSLCQVLETLRRALAVMLWQALEPQVDRSRDKSFSGAPTALLILPRVLTVRVGLQALASTNRSDTGTCMSASRPD